MALDGIYLGPVQDNDQGGSIIMDLSAGREITRSQVDEASMTELVIKQVERMADKQGFGDSLKFTGNKRRILVPNPDLAGVDMEFQLEELDDENYNPVEEEDEDLIVEENVTEEEIEDLRENEVQDQGPETDDRPETVDKDECQGGNEEEGEFVVEPKNIPEQNVRRSSRERRAPEKLSYAQAVTCDSKVDIPHNILTQAINEDRRVTYTKEQAAILAQLIAEIRESFVVHGMAFAQRYSYKKGVEELGEAARKGAYAEVEQMHRRNAFEPIHVKNMTVAEKRKATQSGSMWMICYTVTLMRV